jgi:hypothetical protein
VQNAAVKTASKSADVKRGKPSPKSGFALPVGAHPGNTGGKKGRSGRKPGPFKDLLARLRQSPELAKSLEAAVKDHECRAFPAALKVLTDYDDDKPAKNVVPVEVRVRIEREGRRVTAG